MTRTLIALLLLALAQPALGGAARELSWSDLKPPMGTLADPLAKQPMDVRYDLGFVAKVLADAKSGLISSTSPEYINAMAVKERLRARGVDVDPLVGAVAQRDAEIARRGANVNASLDGELVRISGYALPLEFSDVGIREMLLVPYVGACIHVPPPPPNQIVYARLDDAWKVNGLYEPVWITGRIETSSANRALSFVDGQANVPTGYTMRVNKVEPYK
ncbi:MAG: DUF3299 domain-containing protein [Hyphomicrobiaceae bacterium]